jgi:hypothetical protein
MTAYNVNLTAQSGEIEQFVVEADSFEEAVTKTKAELSTHGLKLKKSSGSTLEYRNGMVAEILEVAPEVEAKGEEPKEGEEPKIVIALDPANSPAGVGEKREYPKAIKTELGTWWGCDQQKLLGTIRLNPHALDTFQVRKAGSRTTFYLGGVVIWATTKDIAGVAQSVAEDLIKSLKAA